MSSARSTKTDEPIPVRGLLDPVERISEILFGLIMALTFTCTISVVDTDRNSLRDMLLGALSCNLAWGLVDAVMFVISTLTYKGRGARVVRFIKNNNDPRQARAYISEFLPPVITSVLQDDDLETIRQRLLTVPGDKLNVRIGMQEIKIAIGVFLLVFISTFPVALPFILIDDPNSALRVSNLVAIILMFTAGWYLGKFGGYNRVLMAMAMTMLGVTLVLITIALGG